MPVDATPILDTLLAGHVITRSHHEAARTKLESALFNVEPFNGLGEGLLWLLKNGVISGDELETLDQDARSQTAFATNGTRKQTLAELGDIHTAETKKRIGEFHGRFWKMVCRGPRWLWLVGGLALIVAIFWVFLTPPSTPECNGMAVNTVRSAQALPGTSIGATALEEAFRAGVARATTRSSTIKKEARKAPSCAWPTTLPRFTWT
ncbi:MAG: hypothetical protein JWQ88_186 [Rhodoferax sp.]|nr:hypothetical protein [Rhodoferax sp.]